MVSKAQDIYKFKRRFMVIFTCQNDKHFDQKKYYATVFKDHRKFGVLQEVIACAIAYFI